MATAPVRLVFQPPPPPTITRGASGNKAVAVAISTGNLTGDQSLNQLSAELVSDSALQALFIVYGRLNGSTTIQLLGSPALKVGGTPAGWPLSA